MRRDENNTETPSGSPVRDLVRFYLACLEEEDRRSLQVSANPDYKQFFYMPGEAGELLRGTPFLEWDPSPSERDFVEQYALGDRPERFLYGYPLHRDKNDYLAPLFFADAELAVDQASGKLRVHLPYPSNIRVNLHLFQASHPGLRERLDLQEKLEASDFGSIEARIEAALREHGVGPTPARSNDQSTLDRLTTQGDETGWKQRALLLRDTGPSFTAQHRRELIDMQSSAAADAPTALSTLLRDEKIQALEPGSLLEISPMNASQREAALAGLSRKLTVITGPPGTGKSQVVLNLMVSLAAQGRPVLFASKNNQAIEVVRNRLRAILDDADWFLRLGNAQHIQTEVNARLSMFPSKDGTGEQAVAVARKKLDKALRERSQAEKTLKAQESVLDEELSLMAELRTVKARLSTAWIEWLDEGNQVPALPPSLAPQELRVRVGRAHRLARPGFFPALLRVLIGPFAIRAYRRFVRSRIEEIGRNDAGWATDHEHSWRNLAEDLACLEMLHNQREAADTLEAHREAIRGHPTPAELEASRREASEAVSRASRAIARQAILSRLQPVERVHTRLKRYEGLTREAAKLSRRAAGPFQAEFGRAARSMLEAIPGITVTNLSARRSLPLEPGLFDCVILDEASQCDLASALPVLFRAKRAVIIGDPKQLRHISSLDTDTHQRIAVENDVVPLMARYSYREKSLYDCAGERIDADGDSPLFLAEHYRSHPEIIEFSNRVYYQRRLVVRSDPVAGSEQAVFWHDVPSTLPEGTGSLVNAKEALAVSELVQRLLADPSFGPSDTLGIVTPYRRQRDAIRRHLHREIRQLDGRLIAGTVHNFQGDECDVMVFSPTVARGASPRSADWISMEEGLLNVALTRARRALHIVGDKDFCIETPGPLGELADFVDQREGVTRLESARGPAAKAVRQLLTELGFWFQEEFPESTQSRSYYLDFFVVGLSGRRYDIEVDGRQHFFSAEAITEDEARDAALTKLGYRVVRIRARDALANRDEVERLLASLT